MQKTDEDLIAAHVQGDQKAFAELVNRYGKLLLGYLVRISGSREQAEDMFQETFLRVHSKATTFREGSKFKPWLFRIATNISIDGIRKSKRRPVTVPLEGHGDNPGAESDILPSRSPLPDDGAMASERKQIVQGAINALPTRQRAALVLSYYHGLTHKEIAEAMQCAPGTVKTHLSRALVALAKLLPDMEGETA